MLADETSMPMQATLRLEKKPKRTYLWTFVSGSFVAYRFSPSRSGATPREVLGGTKGTLVVDAYTGYNAVTGVDPRHRLEVRREEVGERLGPIRTDGHSFSPMPV